MTDREFIYRSSFILGQHLIGYELQKVLALVDMIHKPQGNETLNRLASLDMAKVECFHCLLPRWILA